MLRRPRPHCRSAIQLFDDFSYDGKVMHIEQKRGIVHFYVIISYRKTPGAGLWYHELLRPTRSDKDDTRACG